MYRRIGPSRFRSGGTRNLEVTIWIRYRRHRGAGRRCSLKRADTALCVAAERDGRVVPDAA